MFLPSPLGEEARIVAAFSGMSIKTGEYLNWSFTPVLGKHVLGLKNTGTQ